MMWMTMNSSSAHTAVDRALGERQEDGDGAADERPDQRDQLEGPGGDRDHDGEWHPDDPAAEARHDADDRRHEELAAHVAADHDPEGVEGEVGLAAHAARQQVDDAARAAASPSLSIQNATTSVTRMSRRMVTVEATTLSRIPATLLETSLLMVVPTPLPLSWMPWLASWERTVVTMSLICLISAGPCLLSWDASSTMGVAIR